MKVNIQVQNKRKIPEILSEAIQGNSAICYRCSWKSADSDQPLSAQFPEMKASSRGAFISGGGQGQMYGYGVYTMARFIDNVKGGYGTVIYQYLIRDISKFMIFDRETFYHLYNHFHIYNDDIKGILKSVCKSIEYNGSSDPRLNYANDDVRNDDPLSFIYAQLIYHKVFPNGVPEDYKEWLKSASGYWGSSSSRLALAHLEYMAMYTPKTIGTSGYWNNDHLFDGYNYTYKGLTQTPYTMSNAGKGIDGVIYVGSGDSLCVLPYHYLAATVLRAAKTNDAQEGFEEYKRQHGDSFPKEPLWGDVDPEVVNNLTYQGRKVWYTGDEVIPNYGRKVMAYTQKYQSEKLSEDHVYELLEMMRLYDIAGEYSTLNFDFTRQSDADLRDVVNQWTGTIPKELVYIAKKRCLDGGGDSMGPAVDRYQKRLLERIRQYCMNPSLKLTHKDRFDVDSEFVFKWLLLHREIDCVENLVRLGLNPNIHRYSDWGKDANWHWLYSKESIIGASAAQHIRAIFASAPDPSDIDANWIDQIRAIVINGEDSEANQISALLDANRNEVSDILETYIPYQNEEVNLLEYAWLASKPNIYDVLSQVGLKIRDNIVIPLLIYTDKLDQHEKVEKLKSLDSENQVLDLQVSENFTNSGRPLSIRLGSFLLATLSNSDMSEYAVAFPHIKNGKYIPDMLNYLYESARIPTDITSPYTRAAKMINYIKQKKNIDPRRYLPKNVALGTFLRAVHHKLFNSVDQKTADEIFDLFSDAFSIQGNNGNNSTIDIDLASVRSQLNLYVRGSPCQFKPNCLKRIKDAITRSPSILEQPDIIAGYSYMATIWRFMDPVTINAIIDVIHNDRLSMMEGIDLLTTLDFNQMKKAMYAKSKNGQSAVDVLKSRGDVGIHALQAINDFYAKDGEMFDMSGYDVISYADELEQRKKANKPKLKIRKAWDPIQPQPDQTPQSTDTTTSTAQLDDQVAECLQILQLY